jgi:outer membrane protein
MKSQHYLAVAALACLPLSLMAQPAPKVFTVDMAKVFEGHPQTQAQQAALKADEQKANERLQALEREVRALADRLKEQQSKFDDPTLAAAQKDAIRAEGQRLGQEMQAKQNEGQQLIQKTQADLQQRAQKFRGQVVGEIARAAAEVARRKGGTLVYDRGSLVYADPAYDITPDVLAEVTKAARAQSAPPAKPAPTK